MSSISSVTAGAGAAIITNSSGGAASGKPGQLVEPTVSSPFSVSLPYYTSPRIYVDPQYGEVVYDYRDPATGNSVNQVPSKQALSAYRVFQTPQTSTTASPPTTSTGTAASATGSGSAGSTSVTSSAVPTSTGPAGGASGGTPNSTLV